MTEPDFPPYAFGARLPRTAAGRALWRSFERPLAAGLRRGRDELNDARHRLGLPPVQRFHGGLSEQLCIVATFPELEYPRGLARPRARRRPAAVGAALRHRCKPPPGEAPLVLVAPSTAQDPDHRLLRATVRGLAHEPVRVLASWNRRPIPEPLVVPPNTRLVEWVSYARTMPECALVICHAGHGTLVRALACGVPVLAVPHAGDMAENAARADWAGVGVRLPWPLLRPHTLRLAASRALTADSLRATAQRLAAAGAAGAAGAAAGAGAARAADLVEALALSRRRGGGVRSR